MSQQRPNQRPSRIRKGTEDADELSALRGGLGRGGHAGRRAGQGAGCGIDRYERGRAGDDRRHRHARGRPVARRDQARPAADRRFDHRQRAGESARFLDRRRAGAGGRRQLGRRLSDRGGALGDDPRLRFALQQHRRRRERHLEFQPQQSRHADRYLPGRRGQPDQCLQDRDAGYGCQLDRRPYRAAYPARLRWRRAALSAHQGRGRRLSAIGPQRQ